MFEIGFTELLLCFVVALVVLGPERLPGIARSFGRWTGQARVYLRNLTSELERETQAGELKRQLADASRAIREEADSAAHAARTLGESADVRPKPAAAPSSLPPAAEPEGAAKPEPK